MRWRSPLFVARVDVEKRCLIRDSERTVFPARDTHPLSAAQIDKLNQIWEERAT